MRLLFPVLLFALSGVLPVFAQSAAGTVPPPPTPGHVAELAAVTVSGVQPGPGLWKVSRGAHVLWVLGTQSPLPRDMQWQSQEVAEVISHSQQVLLSPSIKVKADVGFFGKLFLLPLGLQRTQERQRRNPATGGHRAGVCALAGAEAEVHRQRSWHRALAADLRGRGALSQGAQGPWPDQVRPGRGHRARRWPPSTR